MVQSIQLSTILSIIALIISIIAIGLILATASSQKIEDLEARIDQTWEQVLYNEEQATKNEFEGRRDLVTYNSCINDAIKSLGQCLEDRDEADTKSDCMTYFAERRQSCEDRLKRNLKV